MTTERLKIRLAKLERSDGPRPRMVVYVRHGESEVDALARQPVSGPFILAPEPCQDADEWIQRYAPKVPHA